MSISEATLSQWSHPRSAKASKQAHVSIRKALAAYEGMSEFKHEIFLQGSYKNGTNLRRDSDVDVVIQLAHQLKPRVIGLGGQQLEEDADHLAAHERWRSFRRHALKAVRARYGEAVTSGRKTIKLEKGELHADADLVVTLSYRNGIGFYLADEKRWVVSYPQQHHQRGTEKEEAANRRFKRTIRMFKTARNRLVEKGALTKDDAPSYFIECLLYNAPDHLFKRRRATTYTGILDWLEETQLKGFKCQNGKVPLFGRGREQWSVDNARVFVRAMQHLWDEWS